MSAYNPPNDSQSASGVGGGGPGNRVDETTQAGARIVDQNLQERIRYDEPYVFDRPQMGFQDRANGINPNAPDPAKYAVPSAAKDRYFTRRKIIASYPDPGAEGSGGALPTYAAGTDEEVALVQEVEAQQKIAQYDQYCASMFNYKNVPGGIEAIERINPGFTSRRMAQIYADAAFAAKTRAIEMLGQINCTQEDNIFKMNLDNGLISGPQLARVREPNPEYIAGYLASKMSRPTINSTAMPGASNETGFRPTGSLPIVMGTGPDGISEIARTMLRAPETRQADQIINDVGGNIARPPADRIAGRF
jgi:hypothetical protein